MYAIGTLLLLVATSLIITRVATVILTATGMSNEAARFQARSAFTGSGFTTSEAEAVVDHPLRRRVIMGLMLLGNAGLVAAASTLILGFRGGGAGDQGWRILELAIGLVVLVQVSRSHWVDQRLKRMISRLLRRYTDLPTRDRDALVDLADDYTVSELAVVAEDWVADSTLAELALRDEGVAVLAITRSSGRFIGAPSGTTGLRPGDVLVLYGPEDALNEIDQRPTGRIGDARHREAVARHDLFVISMEHEDETPESSAAPP